MIKSEPMGSFDIERLSQLERIIKENPDIHGGIDGFGEIHVSKLLYKHYGDEKRMFVYIDFNFNPPEFNSLIAGFSVWRSTNFENMDIVRGEASYAYSPKSKSYSDLEKGLEESTLARLKSQGFQTASVKQLLKIGMEKLSAALEHPMQPRIWHWVNIDKSFLESIQIGNDPRQKDIQTLKEAGFNSSIIEKLFSQDDLSPLSRTELAFEWVKMIQSGEVALPF